MRVKDVVGRYGEDLAEEFLRSAGFEILERNWRRPEGEIDIIARDGPIVVFVEVKTRSTTAFGDPTEAVTPLKAARIHRLAMHWVDEHRAGGGRWSELRFDVVSIVRCAPGGPDLRHLRGAF